MTITYNPSLEELQKWLAEGNKMPEQIAQLQQLIAQIQSQLQAFTALQASLSAQLAELEKIKDPNADQKKQMETLKAQMQDNQGKINAANSQLASDQGQLTTDQNSFKDFLVASQINSNAMASLGKQLKTTTKSLNESESQAATAQNLQQQAEENRQHALDSVQDYTALAIQSGTDALAQIDRITKDEKAIADDKAKEQELQDKLTKDSIALAGCTAAAGMTFGLSLAAAGYYADQVYEDKTQLDATVADRHDKEADLAKAQEALKADLDALSQANIGELKGLIDQLFAMIEKIFTIMTSGEGSVQDASKALAEVLSFLQMITTKVHQMRSEDQQWMSRGSASSYDVATHQSQVNFQALQELQEYASFMKSVMTAVQIVADVASVAIALASGGTLAPVMAMLMITLTATGVFNKATEALAEKMSKDGATWAKVLADVVVTVCAMVLTFSVSAAASRLTAAGGRAASAAAAQMSQEVEMAVMNMANAVEAEAAAAGRGVAADATKTIVQKVGEFLKDLAKGMVSKQGAGIGAIYFGANNGVVDLATWIYAESIGKGNASKQELEKDKAFQIFELVMTILQAILMMVASKYAFSGQEGQKSMLEQLFGRFENLPKFLEFVTYLQGAGNGAMVVANGMLIPNSIMRGQLTENSGEADAKLLIYKSVQQILKTYEGKEIEYFASSIQQMVESMQTTLRKNAEAEREAARLLLETAV